jgi:hypothetical protein
MLFILIKAFLIPVKLLNGIASVLSERKVGNLGTCTIGRKHFNN